MSNVDIAEIGSGYDRLDEQIAWYDRKSIAAHRWHKSIKLVEVISAILIPMVASYNSGVTAALGAAVVFLEGLQHLNQWERNWITYRSTCESLRHEKYLFLGEAGPYGDLAQGGEAHRVLVERVEALVSTEHARWVSRQSDPQKKRSVTGVS